MPVRSASFDPAQKREILLRNSGIKLVLSADIEQSRSVGGVGNSAWAFLRTAVACLLVSLNEAAEQVLEQSRRWVLESIATNERPPDNPPGATAMYFPGGSEAMRFKTLALCNWLIENQHDQDSLEQSIENEMRYLEDNPSHARDGVNLGLTLPTFLDARAFERVIDLVERGRNFKTITDPPKARSAVGVCYVLARHQLHGEFAEQDVRRALEKFLDRNVNGWLTHGDYVGTAQWMKIAYWNHEAEKTEARQALLRCYDHLKGVQPP